MLPTPPDHAASPSAPPSLPPALSLDDPGVQALRAKTLATLQASLAQMVADVRRGVPMPEVQRAFIARHTTVLLQAYLAARRLGAVRYFAQVSHMPDHWADALVPADPDTVRDRLTFYAAGSVHNLASQVAQAQHDAALHVPPEAQVFYDPSQTRMPAGNPGGGRWLGTGMTRAQHQRAIRAAQQVHAAASAEVASHASHGAQLHQQLAAANRAYVVLMRPTEAAQQAARAEYTATHPEPNIMQRGGWEAHQAWKQAREAAVAAHPTVQALAAERHAAFQAEEAAKAAVDAHDANTFAARERVTNAEHQIAAHERALADQSSTFPDDIAHGIHVDSTRLGDEARTRLDAMIGRKLTDDEIGALVGAQTGDRIRLYRGDSSPYGHKGTVVIELDSARVNAYGAVRELKREGQDLVMDNHEIVVFRRGEGIGTRIFADQVRTLAALGVKRIDTYAIRERQGRGANGYYTWPRLGYDGKTPDGRSLLDVMSTPAGRAAWKANGDSVELHFDLTYGSRSMQVLQTYAEERGIL